MKIGIDLRSLQDKTSRGVSSYARPLIRELAKQNGAEAFVGFASGRLPAPDLGIAVKKIDLPSKIVNASLAFFNYPKIDRLLGTETVWMPNLNFWSFGKGARVVLTIHDLSFLVDPSWYSVKERIWHKAIGAKELIARADKIITLSQHTANELNELLKVPAEKIAVIPPGVPPIKNSPHPPLSQGRDTDLLPLFEKEGVRGILFPYILFLGAVEPRKNIEIALAAFDLLAQKNKDIHFVLAGPRRMNDERWKMDNSDRIHFLDQVSAEQKSVLLKNAKALFFPSLYEGFGFPALEAMSAGAPIVASSAGALPETIGNAGILLDPRGTGAFAEALDQVLNDNALRRILIDRGFERAKNFSWEKCAEETFKIISNA